MAVGEDFGKGVFDAQTGGGQPPAAPPTPAAPPASFGDKVKAALDKTPPKAAEPPAADPASETDSTPAAPPSLAERVKALGFADVSDDTEAIDRVLKAFEERNQRAVELERQLRQAEELEAYRQQLAQQKPTEPESKEPESTSQTWWNPPQVDQAAIELYRSDDGNGWKPETPPQIRIQGEQYQKYVNEWANKLVRNPIEALKPFAEQIKQQLLAEIDGHLEGRRQAETEAQFINRVQQENPWLWETDPVTKQPKVGLDGRSVPSTEGSRMMGYLQRAEQIGIRGAQAQWEYAMQQRELEKIKAQQTQTQAQKTAQEEAEKRKQELLARAAPNVQGRAGFTPPVGQPGHGIPRKTNASFGDKVLAAMKANGVVGAAP